MTPTLPPDLLIDLAPAAAFVRAAWRRGLAPDPERTVDQWADAERKVAPESGSPFPGDWETDRAPYAREIMARMSLHDPCRRVSVAKSAQTGVSECGLNLAGQIMAEMPCPVLVMLPSHGEAQDYNRLKMQPMIDVTPAVRARVREAVSRDEGGSTVTFKRFIGGYLQIVGANSAKNLQMRSARVLINEEISQYPFQITGQGDPMKLAEERLTAFTGREKIADISTPGLDGTCRITKLYERSSKGRFHVPCPHCDTMQHLEFERLRYKAQSADDDLSDVAYVCIACGALIEAHQKTAMIDAGKWVHERPERLETHAGFHINGLYSPFLSWADIVQKYLNARESGDLKEFTQLQLGLPFKEQGDAPDHTKLFEARDRGRPMRRLPTEALWITGAADVQGDRIEWDVYAWGVGMTAWLIDSGIIIGQPADDATWGALSMIVERQYRDARGVIWPIDAFGCDTGYASQSVYRWVSKSPRQETLYALDGQGKTTKPSLGTPTAIDVDHNGKKKGAVKLWPVGTHGLKLKHYAAVRRTIAGPKDGEYERGALLLPESVDEEYCRQMTSEFLYTDPKSGKSQWRVIAGTRNERLDTAVYARALAHHLTDSLSAMEWHNIAARRAADPASMQADLSSYWNESFGLRVQAAVQAPQQSSTERPERWVDLAHPHKLPRSVSSESGRRVL